MGVFRFRRVMASVSRALAIHNTTRNPQPATRNYPPKASAFGRTSIISSPVSS